MRLYQGGQSAIKIARLYGCDKSAVLNALEREGVTRRTNRDLTDDEELMILRIYQSGQSRRKIARVYGKSERLIKGAIKRQLGKQAVLSDARFNYCEGEEQQIAKIYQAGYSITHIARAYGCLYKTIRGSLLRQGVEPRKIVRKPKILKGRKPAQNPIKNETAFDKLDNELSLYWLGFCYADTDTGKYHLRVGLSLKDREQVERLSDFLGCNRDYIKTSKIACIAEFHSPYIVTRLRELGVIARRGEFWRIAKEIPEGLERHFIRGYLDGDGCISDKEKVIFLGQDDILNWIKDCLVKYAGINTRATPYQRRGIKEIGFGGYYQFMKVVDYLYKDATIYLERKKAIADKTKRG